MTESYRLDVIIENVKSFVKSDPSITENLDFNKPINVIVGANGAGKSNILNSIFHSFDIEKLRNTVSNLNKDFSILLHQDVHLPMQNDELNSEDYIEKLPKFTVMEYLNIKKSDGEIISTIFLDKLINPEKNEWDSKEIIHSKLSFRYKNEIPSTTPEFQFKEKIGFFDIFLLNSRTYNIFNDRLMQKISSLTTKIRGSREKSKCNSDLTDVVSNFIPEIQDFEFEDGTVKDGYFNDFIDIKCLSDGYKKSLIIQYLCYLSYFKKVNNTDKMLNILLIDELENGLQILRQKNIPYEISNMIENKKLDKNLIILLTTHSPVVYSSFSKIKREKPWLVDIFYVFRTQNGFSKMIKIEDISKLDESSNEHDKLNEAIELELGLSIFDLPNVMVFVEGFDIEFLKGILSQYKNKDDFRIHRCKGAPESQIWNFIEEHLLSNTRKVVLFFDEDSKKSTEEKVEKIKNPINDIHTMYFKPKELEPFLFGIAKDEDEERENIKKILDEVNKDIAKEDEGDKKNCGRNKTRFRT